MADPKHETTAYRLEVFLTRPPKPAAIWHGTPGDGGRLVADLVNAKPTREEADAMVAALNRMHADG